MTFHQPTIWDQLEKSSLSREDLKQIADFGRALEKALERIEQFVDQQAEDEGLWFVSKNDGDIELPITISEAYLQQGLRKLHALIEDEIWKLKEGQ